MYGEVYGGRSSGTVAHGLDRLFVIWCLAGKVYNSHITIPLVRSAIGTKGYEICFSTPRSRIITTPIRPHPRCSAPTKGKYCRFVRVKWRIPLPQVAGTEIRHDNDFNGIRQTCQLANADYQLKLAFLNCVCLGEAANRRFSSICIANSHRRASYLLPCVAQFPRAIRVIRACSIKLHWVHCCISRRASISYRLRSFGTKTNCCRC